MTKLYLRDLNDETQREYLQVWKNKKMKKLLNADAEGKDIIVGELYDDDECGIVGYIEK